MIPFAIALASVFACLLGASFWLESSLLQWYPHADIAVLISRTILAPTLAGWAMAELVNLFRPLRLFDRRIAKLMPRAMAGIVAGVIGAAAGSLLLAIAGDWASDVVILASCGALGTVLVLIPLRRVRGGMCIHCGYDLRAQPGPGQAGSGVCPECGASTLPRKHGKPDPAAS